jgi:hypothetical protein
MARRAALAPTEEDRIAREVQRARYLAENGRRGESDALWKELTSRIASLPEGAARMRAEAERAGYVERTQGTEAAAETWRALHERYPWSLGLLDDRLAFLARAGRGTEGRRVLAAVLPRAASGHRQELLGRLTREALAAGDLPQARQAVEQLLQQPTLDDSQRLYAIHLFARLSFKEAPSFDALPLAKAEAAKLRQEMHADLYATLAEAADQEKAWGSAVTLWIEALNRRTERAWLQQASRSADRASRLADLLGFFDRQRLRSPRDVRWAVAVRDIKRHAHDVAGAIEMAKAAVAVRPEQEDLWREAVDLLVRADRVAEAAVYLEGWSRPRAADEGVAGWRSGLFARAGEGDKALAVEQAALLAFARAGSDGRGTAGRAAAADGPRGAAHVGLRLSAPGVDAPRRAVPGQGGGQRLLATRAAGGRARHRQLRALPPPEARRRGVPLGGGGRPPRARASGVEGGGAGAAPGGALPGAGARPRPRRRSSRSCKRRAWRAGSVSRWRGAWREPPPGRGNLLPA